VSELGRGLIVAGAVLVLLGVWLTFAGRLPGLGRLPGDFVFGGAHWRVYLPLGTSILLSALLTLLLRLFWRR
jgi:DUF2905 family protein